MGIYEFKASQRNTGFDFITNQLNNISFTHAICHKEMNEKIVIENTCPYYFHFVFQALMDNKNNEEKRVEHIYLSMH